MALFRDRADAGRALAIELARDRYEQRVLVLGLPRGGVPVAYEIAQQLGADLDVLVVRKLGLPGQEELAIGAVASGGVRVLNEELALLVDPETLDEITAREQREVARRDHVLRGDAPPPSVAGRTVILVDDGLATGATMRAAVEAVLQGSPEEVVVAVPVGARESVEALADVADAVVCLAMPDPFYAIGPWYEDFGQVDDAVVATLVARGRQLARARAGEVPPPRAAAAGPMRIELPDATLAGDLDVPADARGLVVFAHGSGSGRHSPRNRAVARELARAGLGTLLFDLLTLDEEDLDARTGHLRFDIDLLSERLIATIDDVATLPGTAGLPIGVFGASTGAAAALRAAAARPGLVRAVVSRGGRPDLAGDDLARVDAPVLLIVGGADAAVLGLNAEAADELATSELVVIPGATHLFEEPGALEQVARVACDWLGDRLAPPQARRIAPAPPPPP